MSLTAAAVLKTGKTALVIGKAQQAAAYFS
jgi:hypothetical protein